MNASPFGRGLLVAGPPRNRGGPAVFVSGLVYGHCSACLCPTAPLFFAAFLVINWHSSITAGGICRRRGTLEAHLFSGFPRSLCGYVPLSDPFPPRPSPLCPSLPSFSPLFPPRWEWVLFVFRAFSLVLPLWSRSGLGARVQPRLNE